MIGNICHAQNFFKNKKPSTEKIAQETSCAEDSPIGISDKPTLPTKPNNTFPRELQDQKNPQITQKETQLQKYNSSVDLSLKKPNNTVNSTLATSFSGRNFLDINSPN
jgi:hypothetical protein